ncbi:MAG TPA: helix-turn-helix transcriptional regulator [Actinomycetota bacterium]
MATLLSVEEISRELFVSTNTVKTHIKHIYRKLGWAADAMPSIELGPSICSGPRRSLDRLP